MPSAEELNDRGNALSQDDDVVGAEAAYRAAHEADPEWAAPCFNLGLLFKYQSRGPESLEWNRRATAIDDEHEGAWWNLGIAATALGDWVEARRAWTACGIDVPAGDGAPEFRWSMTPLRLDPNGRGEVVWGRRLDPARASIVSVPLPYSAHNAGDVVLNDGAANGFRVVNGRQYPVFDVLMVLQPSPLQKYVLELAAVEPSAVEMLERIARDTGGFAEHWGLSTNILCASCSRGIPHEHSSPDDRPANPHCGLAARDDAHAESIIRAWLDGEPQADVIRWYDAKLAPPE